MMPKKITTLSELYGFGAPKSKRTRPLSLSQFRKFVLREAGIFREQEESYAAISPDTNIADVPAEELYRQAISGDSSTPLYYAMINKATATWAAGALGEAGPDKLKAWAENLGPEAFVERVNKVVSMISQASVAKFNMPALEGGDSDEVADALSDSGGQLAVDFSADYAAGIDDFLSWYKTLPDSIRKMYEAGQVPTQQQYDDAHAGILADEKESGSTSTENPAALVPEDMPEEVQESLIKEAGSTGGAFPRYGAGPMPGAPAVGEDSAVDLGAIKGPALAFLTKGMLDGSPGDHITVELDGTMSNSSMNPTQSNILAAKSILLAVTNPAGVTDMGGAFATADGDILDGPHRWSATLISTGGAAEHSGVHKINADSGSIIPLLVTVGNALGRQQKGPSPDDANESFDSRGNADNVILERWRRLAGIL